MSKTEERAIAQKYIGGVPWLMVCWGLGGFFGWLALWPLVAMNALPLWAGFIIATIILCYSYLPTHEAQHGNIGRPIPIGIAINCYHGGNFERRAPKRHSAPRQRGIKTDFTMIWISIGQGQRFAQRQRTVCGICDI